MTQHAASPKPRGRSKKVDTSQTVSGSADDRVTDDGLRFKTKRAGSPFLGNPHSFNGGTISCYVCGVHRRPEERRTARVMGKPQQACEPPCLKSPSGRRAAAEAAAAGNPAAASGATAGART